MNHGVPFDVAFSLEDDMRLAMSIILASFEGTEFDYTLMRFRQR